MVVAWQVTLFMAIIWTFKLPVCSAQSKESANQSEKKRAAKLTLDGVNAVSRYDRVFGKILIDRREIDRSSDARAVLNARVKRIGLTKHLARLLCPAVGERRSDRSGGDGDSADGDRGKNDSLATVFFHQTAKLVRIRRASRAESKIKSADRDLRAAGAHEHVADELFGRKRAYRRKIGAKDRKNTGRAERPEPVINAHESRLTRLHPLVGKSKHRALKPSRFGKRNGAVDQAPVPNVHSVKIAESDHSPRIVRTG